MTTTSTRPPGSGVLEIDRPSRTTVRVALDPRGRVAVQTTTSGGSGPRLRPMLLGSNTTTARVCLVPEGAMLLAGDDIEIRIEVGTGASLELIEPGGTVAHNMRGGAARWDVDVVVGEGASLLWGGEPFVVAAGAEVSRETRMQLGTKARVVLRETLVLGRHCEPGGRVRQRLEATGPNGSPIVVEALALDERTTVGVLGPHRVVASVLALGLNLSATLLPDHRYDLETGGAWWRRLGGEVHRTIPWGAWAEASAACRG